MKIILILYVLIVFFGGPFYIIKFVKRGFKSKKEIIALLLGGTLVAISALFALAVALQ